MLSETERSKNRQKSVNDMSLYNALRRACVWAKKSFEPTDKYPLSLRLIYVISGRSRRSRDVGQSVGV